MTNKDFLRKEILAKRDALTKSERIKYDLIIEKKLLQSPNFLKADVVLLYVSYKSEVNTIPIIEAAIQMGKAVYVPKILDSENSIMGFYRWSNECGEKNRFGIVEPCTKNIFIEEKDKNVLAIFPGVAFDIVNNRIGYGKGYYDLYFKNIVCYKIGICYAIQKVEHITATALDIPVDELITN